MVVLKSAVKFGFDGCKREEIVMEEQIPTHEGGCLCGAVRYRVTGGSDLTGVCHCRYCQLRTASAFAVLVYFSHENFELLSGDLTRHDFTSESGKKWETNFCVKCGTTVCLELEVFENKIAIEAGTFDPPTFWFTVTNEVFIRSKAHFVGDIVSSVKDETFFSYDPVSGEHDRLSSETKSSS